MADLLVTYAFNNAGGKDSWSEMDPLGHIMRFLYVGLHVIEKLSRRDLPVEMTALFEVRFNSFMDNHVLGDALLYGSVQRYFARFEGRIPLRRPAAKKNLHLILWLATEEAAQRAHQQIVAVLPVARRQSASTRSALTAACPTSAARAYVSSTACTSATSRRLRAQARRSLTRSAADTTTSSPGSGYAVPHTPVTVGLHNAHICTLAVDRRRLSDYLAKYVAKSEVRWTSRIAGTATQTERR